MGTWKNVNALAGDQEVVPGLRALATSTVHRKARAAWAGVCSGSCSAPHLDRW